MIVKPLVEDLPEELLLHILELLDEPTSHTAKSVCRKWRRVLNGPPLPTISYQRPIATKNVPSPLSSPDLSIKTLRYFNSSNAASLIVAAETEAAALLPDLISISRRFSSFAMTDASNNGKWIAAWKQAKSGNDGELHIINLDNGEQSLIVNHSIKDKVVHLLITTQVNIVAVINSGGISRQYRIAVYQLGEQAIKILPFTYYSETYHEQPIRCVLALDNSIIAGVYKNTNIILWNIAADTKKDFIDVHKYPIYCLAKKDQCTIISSDITQKIRIMNIVTGTVEKKLYQPNTNIISHMLCLRNGRYIVTGTQDGFITVWDSESAKCKWQKQYTTLFTKNYSVTCLMATPNGNSICGFDDGSIWIININSNEQVNIIKELKLDSAVTSIATSRTGETIYASSKSGTIAAFTFQSGFPVSEKEISGDSLILERVKDFVCNIL